MTYNSKKIVKETFSTATLGVKEMKQTICIVLIFLTIGCSHARTPKEVAATRLTEIAMIPSMYQAAAVAAAVHLKGKGEEPSEFYVSGITQKGTTIVLPLWHESAFELKEPVVGNPGGKCRDLEYNAASKQITGTWFWQ